MKLRAARGVGLSPKIAVGAAGGILVLGLVVALATGHRGADLADSMTQALATQTTGMGFTVQEIHVAGATPAGEEAIRAVLAPAKGQAILGLDLALVRAGVENVGWVEKAKVVRLLPNTLMVEVKERGALAVWQKNGRLMVIDGAGRTIPEADPAAFPQLPLVVGQGAEAVAGDILKSVASRPRLKSRVEALVRVDERRWDIHLKDGSIILLPAVDEESALIELDLLDRRDAILEAGLERIDLREPGAPAFRRRQTAQVAAPVEGGV
ncbi:cell division protein FtsQ/DivIB [Caulobacter sp. NIBR1757]|uniref:cell division protein FtsQ/DivIB n=1 Tax=Caulobacter sp. NIBR1757 TaxID=3016000 RepID=UPI0022EFF253|nr:cell division protein FtsQ/DivIB [Caulobacter sp. NIBR1757]WGM39966.1 Cell division protein FtsQ [Caulobacter sp. NIBR1757]